VIAWALEEHPEGLFLKELKEEYRTLCELTGANEPYTDDGDFQGSLARHLWITLSICHAMGWLSFRFERPDRAYQPKKTGQFRAVPLIPEHLWTLTKTGKKANRWPESKVKRSTAIYLFKRGIAPVVEKVRLPLALASALIGVAKIVSGWGEFQTVLEGVITIAGSGVLALLHPTLIRTTT
jgi:hypothetical protein